jgi:hypothetical protein
MRIREVLPDQIRLEDGLSISWNKVRELKVYNDTLRLVLSDQREVEVGGLSSGEVDQLFRSYSHFRLQKMRPSPR